MVIASCVCLAQEREAMMKRLLAFIAASIGFASCIWAATTDLSTVKSNITLADDTAARFALHGRPAPKKLAQLKVGNVQSKAGGAKGVRLLQASGPSYPASVGGDKSYEYISSFTVTPKDGYYKITVKVICPQLYNAEGYPNYGSETEFVNVWIDWNGDYSWSASERVMAKSSANYKKILADNKILYFEATVKDASTVGGTFRARAMLGWGYNPTNPTTYSWAWGDVKDIELSLRNIVPEFYGMTFSVGEDLRPTGESPKISHDNSVIASWVNYIYPEFKVKASLASGLNLADYKLKVSSSDYVQKQSSKSATQKEWSVDGVFKATPRKQWIGGEEYSIFRGIGLDGKEIMWIPKMSTDKNQYGSRKMRVELCCNGKKIFERDITYFMFYDAKKLLNGSTPMWYSMWKNNIVPDLKKFVFDPLNNDMGYTDPDPGIKNWEKIEGTETKIKWVFQYYICKDAWDVLPTSKRKLHKLSPYFTETAVKYPIDEVFRTVDHELTHGIVIGENDTGVVMCREGSYFVAYKDDNEGEPYKQKDGTWKWREGDLLTPARETKIHASPTDNKTDTFSISSIQGWDVYKSDGDQELYCRWASDTTWKKQKYYPKDWSFPGAQLGYSNKRAKAAKNDGMLLSASGRPLAEGTPLEYPTCSSCVLSQSFAENMLNRDYPFAVVSAHNVEYVSFADKTEDFVSQGLVLEVGLEHDLEGEWTFVAYLFGTNGMAIAKAQTVDYFDSTKKNIEFVFAPDVLAKTQDYYVGSYVLGLVECLMPHHHSGNIRSSKNLLTTKDYSTCQCRVSEPQVGGVLGDYADEDGLHVIIPIIVPSSRAYEVSAFLATTNGENLVNVTTNCVCAEGRNEIDICFPNRDVFNTKVTGRFMVRDVSVAADGEEPSLFVCDYETNPYDYFDFGDDEKSIIIWPETVVLSASQDDDDSGELYNGVSVKFDASNYDYDDETLYRVSAVLVDTNGYNVAYAEEDMMVNGYATLSLFFPAQEIRESGNDGPYSVKWVKISDRETGEVIDACAVSDAKTDLLVSGDFKSGLFVDEDAMQLSDVPISNGLYAGLQLAVPVNVPSDGYVTLSAFVYTADGKLVERFESERAVVSGDNQLILHMDGAQFRDSGMDGPYEIRSIEVRHSSFPEHPCVVERVFNTDAYTHTQFFGLGRTRFEENVLKTDEGENVVVRISGGSTNVNSNVKVFLMYNTGVAADLDLANGTVDGVTPKGGLKFPLTLNWDVGEVGEKVVTIPVKTDKATEDDEFFTLQLADPQGMELSEKRVCKVTVHDPGYDSLGEKVANNLATPAEIKDWEKLQAAKAPYILGIADSANAGKVTGSGVCAVNKKVTLKATANKGFVFVGWTDSQIAMDGDRITSGAVQYLATTPSLVIDRTAKPTATSKTSTTITNVNDDVAYYANFVTAKEDRSAISLAVHGLNVAPVESGMIPVWTNICGVAVDWLVASAGLSATTVKATGLPQGLKLVQDKETGNYFVQGAPTAASKIDAKTGIMTPSKVTFTVTTAGKTSEVFGINLIVLPLPDWAHGTFVGVVDVHDDEGSAFYGFATMSVAANGKISGKMTLTGTNWTFGASCYDWRYSNSYMEDSDEYVFVSEVEAKSGKMIKWFDVEVSRLSSSGTFANGVAYGWGNDVRLTMWRNMWKDKTTASEAKAELAKWDGVYTLSFLPGDDYGSGYLSLTVGKDGNVKATGKLADGTSVSATSPLMYDEDAGWFTMLYAAPSAYKGGAFAAAVGFEEQLTPVLFAPQWSSCNVQATGEYGEGFEREVDMVGAYYNKLDTLRKYYESVRVGLGGALGDRALPELGYTFKETSLNELGKKATVSYASTVSAVDTLGQSGLTATVNEKGVIVVEKATKPVQDKKTKEWSYNGTNDGALTLSFTQATGIFKGSYTFWYDYVSAYDDTTDKETWAHTSKKATFEGIFVQGEEPKMEGFYLWDATGEYEDEKTGKLKSYKYKQSFPVRLLAQ